VANKGKFLRIVTVALSVVIVLALAGLVYGIVEIYRLRTGVVNLPMYTSHEMVALPELTGEELLTAIKYNGMKYAIIGDYVYYASHDHNLYMYRFNLETYAHELYLQAPVFGVITDGETLFFIAGTLPDTGIFSIDPMGGIQAIAYNVDIEGEFRKYRGVIFYSDIYGQARTILPCGRPIVL